MSRRPIDPRKSAEALFKPVAKASPEPADRRPIVPGARETVSLRIDSAVLEHFQSEGPGWQDRINDALRRAAGIGGDGSSPFEKLDARNDG